MNNNDSADMIKHISANNKEIFLVGTAHVSKQSILDVKNTIEEIRPDTVCIELCESRYKAIKHPDNWKNIDIFKIVKEGRSFFLFAQMVMTAFYRNLGDQLDVQPGGEMIEAIRLAEEMKLNLVCADRDVQITLKRLWGALSFWNRMKLLSSIVLSLFETKKIDNEMVEQIKNSDQLETMLQEFSKDMPEIKEKLITERDIYLSQKIRRAGGSKVVAVVGAGHVPGIIQEIQKESDIACLEQLQKKSPVNITQFIIPLIIVILFLLVFLQGGVKSSVESIYLWILITGSCSALGTILSLGHPLSVITSFIAAPITTIHPLLAAGWFSGLTQAWIKKPKVKDFENLPKDITTFKGFWKNSITKVLLNVILTNVGASVGTFTAGYLIVKKL